MFLVQAAIARWWGSDVLAEYLLLISAANIAAMVMPLGFQTIGSYFAVDYAAHGRLADLMRFVRRAYLQTAACAVLIAACTWALVQWAGLNDTLAGLVLPGLLFAMAMASVFICSALLVGLKHPFAGLLTDGLFPPLGGAGWFSSRPLDRRRWPARHHGLGDGTGLHRRCRSQPGLDAEGGFQGRQQTPRAR
jgi:hypothetical protein